MAMRYSRGTVFLGAHGALVVSDCNEILIGSLFNSLVVEESFRVTFFMHVRSFQEICASEMDIHFFS